MVSLPEVLVLVSNLYTQASILTYGMLILPTMPDLGLLDIFGPLFAQCAYWQCLCTLQK